MNLTPDTPTTKTRLQLLLTLALTIVMVISTLAFTPPADATRGFSFVANGVSLDNGQYYCDKRPATPVNTRIVQGTKGPDVILAMGDNVQSVNGLGGNDIICVVTPGAVINGGAGNDRIYTPDLPADWPDHLQPPIATTKGGPGNDVVFGGSSWDNISGGGGHDRLYGGAGYDYLWGDAGNDYFDGGPNGDRAPNGVAVAGDLCNDSDPGVVKGADTVDCERNHRDPFSTPQMPDVPVPVEASCRHPNNNGCGFTHFR